MANRKIGSGETVKDDGEKYAVVNGAGNPVYPRGRCPQRPSAAPSLVSGAGLARIDSDGGLTPAAGLAERHLPAAAPDRRPPNRPAPAELSGPLSASCTPCRDGVVALGAESPWRGRCGDPRRRPGGEGVAKSWRVDPPRSQPARALT